MARVRIRKRNQRKTTISTSAAVDATSDLLALKAPQLSSITTTITSSNAGDKLLNLPANAASITASKEQPPVKRKRRRIRKRKSASSKKTTETDSKEENSKEEEEEEVEDEQAAVISQSATPTAAVVATLSIPNEKQIKTHDDESQAIQVLGSSPSAATTSDIIDAEKLKSLGKSEYDSAQIISKSYFLSLPP